MEKMDCTGCSALKCQYRTGNKCYSVVGEVVECLAIDPNNAVSVDNECCDCPCAMSHFHL